MIEIIGGVKFSVGDIVYIKEQSLNYLGGDYFDEWRVKELEVVGFNISLGQVIVKVAGDESGEKHILHHTHLVHKPIKQCANENITPKQMLKNGDRVKVERCGWFIFIDGHLYSNSNEQYWLNLNYFDDELNEDGGDAYVVEIYSAPELHNQGRLLDMTYTGKLKWQRPVCPEKAAAEALVAKLKNDLAKAEEELKKYV